MALPNVRLTSKLLDCVEHNQAGLKIIRPAQRLPSSFDNSGWLENYHTDLIIVRLACKLSEWFVNYQARLKI